MTRARAPMAIFGGLTALSLALVFGGCPLDLNYPPTPIPTGNKIVCPDTTVTMSAAASTDPNGDELTFHWTQTEGPVIVDLINADSAETSFSTSVTGTYDFKVTVSDGRGGSEFTIVEITVQMIHGVCPGSLGT